MMQPAGLELYNIRKVDKSEVYSYENKPEKLSDLLEQVFIANDKVWKFFNSQPASYQRTAMYRIMSAKREETRLSRLNKLILSCEQSKRLAYS
jgi:uncharacterized protein YdeI (YjbR/CyaY-like superfamily)